LLIASVLRFCLFFAFEKNVCDFLRATVVIKE